MTSKPTTVKKPTTARKNTATTETPKPRISTARHRKAASTADVEVSVAVMHGDRHAAVAKIAYGFWEMRGFQEGDPASDWFRAEEEYGRQMTAGA